MRIEALGGERVARIVSLNLNLFFACVVISFARPVLAESIVDYGPNPRLQKVRSFSLSHYSEAMQQLGDDISKAKGKEKADLLLIRAAILQDHDKMQKALADCQAALAVNPKLAEAYFRESVVYITSDQPDKAVRAIDECVKLDPQSWHAHYLRGKICSMVHKLPEAYEDFTFCTHIKTMAPPAYEYRAGVLVQQNKLREAIDDYTEAIRTGYGGPETQRCMASRAKLYYKLGMKDLGDKDMAAVKKRTPSPVTELLRF